MLQGVCREFQVPLEAGSNTMETLAALEEHLLAVAAKNRPAVLVLDDAHALSETNLEQLRLLINLEVSGGKLMQVVLSGQQDLNQCLQRNSAKQLRQRVFRNYHITRLAVVGTTIGTQVIKDGQRVRVDGESGEVQILS